MKNWEDRVAVIMLITGSGFLLEIAFAPTLLHEKVIIAVICLVFCGLLFELARSYKECDELQDGRSTITRDSENLIKALRKMPEFAPSPPKDISSERQTESDTATIAVPTHPVDAKNVPRDE